MIREIVMNSGLLFLGSNILIGILEGSIEICSRIQKLERNMKMNGKVIVGIETIFLTLSILGVVIIALFVAGNMMDSY